MHQSLRAESIYSPATRSRPGVLRPLRAIRRRTWRSKGRAHFPIPAEQAPRKCVRAEARSSITGGNERAHECEGRPTTNRIQVGNPAPPAYGGGMIASSL